MSKSIIVAILRINVMNYRPIVKVAVLIRSSFVWILGEVSMTSSRSRYVARVLAVV